MPLTIDYLQSLLMRGEYSFLAYNMLEQRKAIWELNAAIFHGKIKKKNCCQVCGKKATGEYRRSRNGWTRVIIHSHHWNYRFPFDVVFLCGACHWAVHNRVPD